MKKTLVALVLASLAGAVMAQQTAKPEDMIKFRKAGMNFMSWNMGRIKANIDGSFNKEQVVAAANVVAGTANSDIVALYGPGTDKDIGNEKTRAKPEMLQDSDKRKQAMANLVKEANELAKVAAAGDAAAVKAQFGKVGGTCKDCHDDFRRN